MFLSLLQRYFYGVLFRFWWLKTMFLETSESNTVANSFLNFCVRALEVHLGSVPYGLVLYRRLKNTNGVCLIVYTLWTAAKLLVLTSKEVDKEIAGTTPPPSFEIFCG